MAWQFWLVSGNEDTADKEWVARKLDKAIRQGTCVIVQDGHTLMLHYTMLGMIMIDAHQRQN